MWADLPILEEKMVTNICVVALTVQIGFLYTILVGSMDSRKRCEGDIPVPYTGHSTQVCQNKDGRRRIAAWTLDPRCQRCPNSADNQRVPPSLELHSHCTMTTQLTDLFGSDGSPQESEWLKLSARILMPWSF